MIPLQPTLSCFQLLDPIITKFYWKDKTQRIKLTTPQKPKTQGGLAATTLLLLLFRKSVTICMQMETFPPIR